MWVDYSTPFSFLFVRKKFLEFLSHAQRQGVVLPWACHVRRTGSSDANEVQTVWLAVPKMNRLCRYLLQPVQQHYQSKVAVLCRSGLQLVDAQELGVYDWVVVTVPRAQLFDLMPESLQSEYQWMAAAKPVPQTVLMVQIANWQPEFDVLLPNDSVIERVVVDAHKPGRVHAGCAVVYAHSGWSLASQNKPDEAHRQELLEAFLQLSGASAVQVLDAQWHHWKLAKDDAHSSSPVVVNREWRHIYVGDWLAGGDVSGAYRSALAGVDFLRKGY